jgi:hypothetical protein
VRQTGERRDAWFQRIVRGLDHDHRIEQFESAAKKAAIAAWREDSKDK